MDRLTQNRCYHHTGFASNAQQANCRYRRRSHPFHDGHFLCYPLCLRLESRHRFCFLVGGITLRHHSWHASCSSVDSGDDCISASARDIWYTSHARQYPLQPYYLWIDRRHCLHSLIHRSDTIRDTDVIVPSMINIKGCSV